MRWSDREASAGMSDRRRAVVAAVEAVVGAVVFVAGALIANGAALLAPWGCLLLVFGVIGMIHGVLVGLDRAESPMERRRDDRTKRK